MVTPDVVTFREFMMQEPLPLATIQRAVLEFLRDRDDVVVFGAQAVNAYVDEPRMTQNLDLISIDAEAVAQALCDHLRDAFRIAVRIRRVADGRGLRVFQVRKSGNRHLVDLRSVEELPPSERIAGILVMEPAALIASKVISYRRRKGQPKSGSDWRDIAQLLLRFPMFKRDPGPVRDALRIASADAEAFSIWQDLATQDFQEAEDDEF